MPESYLTVSDAARRWGVNRRTVQRKLNRGELERVPLPNGAHGVSVASLERVLGPAVAPSRPDATLDARATAAPLRHAAAAGGADGAVELAALRVELAGAQAVIAAKEAHLADLRAQLAEVNAERRDLQAALSRAQTNLLVAQTPEAGHVVGRAMGATPPPTATPATPPPAQARRPRARRAKASPAAPATAPAARASAGWWGRIRQTFRGRPSPRP